MDDDPAIDDLDVTHFDEDDDPESNLGDEVPYDLTTNAEDDEEA